MPLPPPGGEGIHRVEHYLVRARPQGLPRPPFVGSGRDEYGASARDAAGKTPRGLAVELVAELRKLNRRIIKVTNGIQVAVIG
jgi:hypothetical protein